jgi:transcription antitermination factor NusG
MNVEQKQELRKDFLENGFDSYVFFTLSNKEVDLAEELNGKYEDLYALVLKRMMHRSDHGKKWDEESVLIKGYVFIYVPKGYDIRYIRSDNNPYRILKWQLELGKLFGDDYRYSEWVLQQDGLIGVSKAIKVNEMVKIVDGPLADFEGCIVKYSKRNRNCLVEVNFMNQTIRTWLPFEWTDQNYIMDDKQDSAE